MTTSGVLAARIVAGAIARHGVPATSKCVARASRAVENLVSRVRVAALLGKSPDTVIGADVWARCVSSGVDRGRVRRRSSSHDDGWCSWNWADGKERALVLFGCSAGDPEDEVALVRRIVETVEAVVDEWVRHVPDKGWLIPDDMCFAFGVARVSV